MIKNDLMMNYDEFIYIDKEIRVYLVNQYNHSSDSEATLDASIASLQEIQCNWNY
jgi:hypothetical protein